MIGGGCTKPSHRCGVVTQTTARETQSACILQSRPTGWPALPSSPPRHPSTSPSSNTVTRGRSRQTPADSHIAGGKRDETLILPINDSVSVTLSSDQMHAKTSVMASQEFLSDKIWLNRVEESASTGRLASCLASVREAARVQGDSRENTMQCQAGWLVEVYPSILSPSPLLPRL